MNTGYANPYVVSQAPANERAAFIRKTYLHVAGAIGAFALLEWVLITFFGPQVEGYLQSMANNKMIPIIVFGVYIGVSMLADRWAMSETSRTVQYFGLGVYIVTIAIVMLPLLYFAANFINEPVIAQAALITGALVAGLTMVVFTTKQDFSFLRGIVVIGGMVAIGVIAASMIFDFPTGNLFASAMVILLGASILYQTSNIIHHYRPDQYVGASLGLFASIATMFFYILRILISLSSND